LQYIVNRCRRIMWILLAEFESVLDDEVSAVVREWIVDVLRHCLSRLSRFSEPPGSSWVTSAILKAQSHIAQSDRSKLNLRHIRAHHRRRRDVFWCVLIFNHHSLHSWNQRYSTTLFF
jgi:hypothetical protein